VKDREKALARIAELQFKRDECFDILKQIEEELADAGDELSRAIDAESYRGWRNP